jgi:surface protein
VSDERHQTILAGGVSGGMWRTTDGGQTWTRTFAPDQRPSVTALAQDTRSGRQDVWYAGTGEFRGNSATGGSRAFYRGNGIYRSVDGGQSWRLLPRTTSDEASFDSPFDYTWAVEVDPSAPTGGSAGTDSEVYAATFGQISRSTDGGGSWTPVLESNTGGSSSRYTDVEVTSAGVIYAALGSRGDRSGIFVSTSGAPGSFTDITPNGLSVADPQRAVLAINSSDESEIWVLARTGSGPGPNGHMLWRYERSSGTWTEFTGFLPNRGGVTGTFSSQVNYDLIVEVHPADGSIVYVGGRNLWRLDVSARASDANTWIGGYTSSNSGFGFYSPSGSAPHHPDQHALAFEPGNGDVMYVGSDGGIHRTNDNRAGTTGSAGDGEVLWTDLNNGYFTTQFYAVCQFRSPDSQTERIRLAGGMQDNGTWNTASKDVSEEWSRLFGADGGYCSLTNNATSDGSSRYVSIQGGRVFRLSYDAGGDFLGSRQASPRSASGQLFINPFAVDPSDADVMYFPAGSNLWRNDALESNPSDGWSEMTGAEASEEVITALGVSKSSSANVLYYGTGSGTLKRLDDANTAPASASPTDITGGRFPSSGYVSSVAVDPTDSDRVMAVFSNYNVTSLFFSTDGGSNWTPVEGNLGADEDFSPSVRSAAILPPSGQSSSPTEYYVGTSIGIYSTSSLDGSNTTWRQEGAQTVGDVVVDQVQARMSDGRLIAGSHANGTFSKQGGQQDEEPFITTWETTSSGESITIPTENSGTDYDFTVDWGDGTTEQITGDDPDPSHEYSSAGTHRVEITGRFPRIFLDAGDFGDGDRANARKLRSIDQWGSIQRESMQAAFAGASNMTYSATDTPNLSNVASMRFMFEDAESFNGDISDWDVSSVTDMRGTFEDASSFNRDISTWNVSNVTRMGGMFARATSFNQPIGSWDVSSVTDMGFMFLDATAFDQDIGAWDVSSVDDSNPNFPDSFEGFLDGSGLSTANYDALLTGWEQLDLTDGLTFGAGDIQYSADAEAARQAIIDGEGWTINDGGLAGVTLSGTLFYPIESQGSLQEGRPLAGPIVEARRGGSVAAETDAGQGGSFELQLQPDATYQVGTTASGLGEALGPGGGAVDVVDALRVAQASVGERPFAGPFQEKVADVNGDGDANTVDALQIARRSVGQISGFEAGAWAASTEEVELGSEGTSGIGPMGAEQGDANLSGGTESKESALQVVSGPAGGWKGGRKGEPVEKGEPAGSVTQVPVRLSERAEVGAFQLQLSYPAEKVSFEGASVRRGKALAHAEEGTAAEGKAVQVGWFDQSGSEPLRVEEGGRLLTLRFKAKSSQGKSSRGQSPQGEAGGHSSQEEAEGELSLTLEGGSIAGPEGEPIVGVAVQFPPVTVGLEGPEEFALEGPAPNPTRGRSALRLDLPREATVTVTVYNTLGQRIRRSEQRMGTGSGQVLRLGGRGLPSGQYFYRLEANLGGKTVRRSGRWTVLR